MEYEHKYIPVIRWGWGCDKSLIVLVFRCKEWDDFFPRMIVTQYYNKTSYFYFFGVIWNETK